MRNTQGDVMEERCYRETERLTWKKKSERERIREKERNRRSKRDRRAYHPKDKESERERERERQLPVLISQWQQLCVSVSLKLNGDQTLSVLSPFKLHSSPHQYRHMQIKTSVGHL